MNGSLLLLAALISAVPAVSATRLDESVVDGSLSGLEGDSVQIDADGQTTAYSLADLRFLSFPDVEPPSQFDDPPAVDVILVDGSRLACTGFEISKQTARLATEDFGEVGVPLAGVRSIRMGDLDRVQERWQELQQRENRTDLLVVRKQDLLDFVEGSVGEVTATEVAFLLDGNSIKVPRDRAFGIVYAQRPPGAAKAAAQVHARRNLLQAKTLSFDGSGFLVETLSGTSLNVPVEKVHLIEFQGRVRFLHEMDAAVEYPADISELDRIWHFRKGTASNGAPLRVGSDEVITPRGLWMHSGVTARYRINRDYRRLTAKVGMDHNVGGDKSVRLLILGDGKPLFDERIAYDERARELDLDVTGVRDIEIRVERLPEIAAKDIFGIREHLSLGDIRVIR